MISASTLRRIVLLLCAICPYWANGTDIDGCFSRRIWNVRPHEYGGDSQIWSITNDDLGCIYLAAGSYLCSWDGYTWDSRSIDDRSVIRDLFWDPTGGRLYSTGDNFFGFWQRDNYGELEYHNLYSNDDLSKNQIFWRIVPCGKDFYLQTHDALCLYGDKGLETIATGRIGYLLPSADKIYLQIDDNLSLIEERSLRRIATAPNDRIVFLEECGDGTIILLTEISGFFRIRPGSDLPEPVYPQASRLFSRLRVFSACKRPTGGYLVGTVLDGAYTTDAEGNVQERFTSANGLDHTTVLSVKEDSHGDILLGLDGGAAWIRNNRFARFFTSPSRRIGYIYASAVWNGTLYLGTNKGLYRVGEDRKPHMLPNTQGQIWDLIPLERSLAVIADKGLYCLADDDSLDMTAPYVWKVIPIPGMEGSYCASDNSGLLLLGEDGNGKLSVKNRLENYTNPDNSVLFDKYGCIWVEWLRGKARRLVPDSKLSRIKESREYSVGNHPNGIVRAFRIDGEVVFTSGRECYTYMPHLDSLMPNVYYTELFSRFGARELNVFQQGNAFFNYSENSVDMLVRSGQEIHIARDIFHSSEFEQLPKRFRRIQILTDTTVVCGFSEALGMVAIRNAQPGVTPEVYLHKVSYETRGEQRYARLDEALSLPYATSNLAFSVSSTPSSSLEYNLDGGDWNPITGPVVIKVIESGNHILQIGYGGKVLKEFPFTVRKHVSSQGWFLLLLLALLILLAYIGKRIYQSRVKRLRAKYEARQKELIEKEHVLHQNEMLSLELRERDKKLSMLALNDITVNNMLNDILDRLQSVTDPTNRNALKPVRLCIEKYKRDNGTWKTFELYFNGIFDGFFDRLRARYPNLTNNDLKICAYVKLGMSTKEIAALMNIEISSAESARYRLRKNMGLAQSESLTEIVTKI